MQPQRIFQKDYKDIAARRESGDSLLTIAQSYGVSKARIGQICSTLTITLPLPPPAEVDASCVICTKIFTKKRRSARKTCSPECRHISTGLANSKSDGKYSKARLKTLVCQQCQKTFQRSNLADEAIKQSMLKKGVADKDRKFFCTRECFHAFRNIEGWHRTRG